MSTWIKQLEGRFIVFDGPDGSGKSTQFKRFMDFCHEQDLAFREVREPGGTSIGEQIRKVLLDPENTEMSLKCEMMLYMASRAQLIEQVVNPARADGLLVLADRFVSSTLAYQGTAGGLDLDEIMHVGRVAIGDNWPDLTVIFDVDEKTSRQRRSGRYHGAAQPSLFDDRIERRESEFHEKVRQGFLDQVEAQPDRYLLIDATKAEDKVYKSLLDGLRERLAE
ncbi:MAG: dTMP kinase [Planctomycetota bacterium]|nr:dTMP kinase [Planctomycetota bacterium]